MKKRFGADSFDMKILKRKCNKKCRDTNRKYLKLQTGDHKEGTNNAELLPPRDEEVEDEETEEQEEEEEEAYL